MDFSMAFQPIVDVHTERVYAYEALVRGPEGQGAGSVLSQITPENRYSFDQTCRVQAITLASRLGLADNGAFLSINFLPKAVYSPAACIQLTLKTARELNFPTDRLIFEITEGEEVENIAHLQAIADEYQKHGFRVAIDDYGAGFANMNLLANLSSDLVKLDMELVRDIHLRPKSRAIVRSTAALCQGLGMEVIAEGIENFEEYEAVRACGIHLMQGYLFAKPAFEQLPRLTMPRREIPSSRDLPRRPSLNILQNLALRTA